MSDTSGFIIHPRGIEARVSPSEAGKLIGRFLQRNSGASMLLFLELPSPKEGYKDLYYLTGLTGATAMEIFGMDEEILTHDGLINWGFMIPSEKTQIGKYGSDTIWLMADKDKLENYKTAFIKSGIKEVSSLNPPSVSDTEYKDPEGHTIYDTVKALISLGMIKTETVKI